jgi:hypothetical protein
MQMMMSGIIMIIIPFHDDDDRDYYDHHPISLQRQGIRSNFVTTSWSKKVRGFSKKNQSSIFNFSYLILGLETPMC